MVLASFSALGRYKRCPKGKFKTQIRVAALPLVDPSVDIVDAGDVVVVKEGEELLAAKYRIVAIIVSSEPHRIATFDGVIVFQSDVIDGEGVGASGGKE